jgi:hypothetical protein
MQPLSAGPAGARPFRQSWAWWFMVAMLVVIAVARLRLLNFPLERDEGEYAYAGQLLLQGIPPYQLAYNMKFPGTYAGYAAIMAVFGQTPAGIHFGLLLLTTATALMLFWLGRKMLDETAGVIAATTYAMLACSTAMFGLAAHATHFCAFFATAGLCLMWQARQNKSGLTSAAAAFLFGTAILMKQHAALIALWAALVWTVWCLRRTELSVGKRLVNLVLLGLAMILPFLLCCLMLWRAGVFERFWFWTVGYGREYVSITNMADIWPRFWWSLCTLFSDCWLWWFGAVGLAVLWFEPRLQGKRGWLFGFAAASLLATAPGFYFRTHYFLLTIPAAALLAGVAISGGIHLSAQKNSLARFRQWPVGVYVLVLAFALFKYNDVWSVLGRFGSHALYGAEPFAEAETTAAFIRANSSPTAQVAVIGSEPEICFLARRHSATGYILTFALMEPQPFARKMQDEMIGEIERAAPEYVVFANVGTSWLQAPGSDMKIFNWWSAYATNYDLTGIADTSELLHTRYFWNEDAVRHGRLKNAGLEIYRRKVVASTNGG